MKQIKRIVIGLALLLSSAWAGEPNNHFVTSNRGKGTNNIFYSPHLINGTWRWTNTVQGGYVFLQGIHWGGIRFVSQSEGQSTTFFYSDPVVGTYAAPNFTSAGYFISTNSVSTWPATPRNYGEAYIGNVDGVTYILSSSPTELKWVATNKLAPY